MRDNEEFEEMIRAYEQGNNNSSASNSSNTSYDGDAQEISISDNYRGECVVEPMNDGLDYQPAPEDDDELRKYMNTLLVTSQTYTPDDYHIVKK